MSTIAERHTRLHFKLKQEAAMSNPIEDLRERQSKENLNVAFQSLEATAMRVKRDRDALLEAAKTALFCAELEIKLNNKPWEGPAKQLREAIALAEKE